MLKQVFSNPMVPHEQNVELQVKQHCQVIKNQAFHTVELPYNVTLWDQRKSIVIGELSLQPNYNKSLLK